ncbi:MAG: dipeptidase [Candidatus Korobacteraceae bacterium]
MSQVRNPSKFMQVFSHVLLATLFLPAVLAAQSQAPAARTSTPTAKSQANFGQSWRAIHESAIIIDTHADTPGRFVDENFDLAQDAGTGYMDFKEIKAGNLGAEFFSIWVEPKANKGHEAKRALDMIDSVYEQARRHPDQMMMAFSTQDILTAHREHKLAALLGVEGGHAIEGDIRILRDYYRLGVRYMTLTWSNTNDIGDSSGDIDDKSIQHHGGLTDFGRQVVTEMNRMGMMVDISHVADSTFYQALEVSRAPVIASHSSSRALTNAPRNMTDDMLRALAAKNGVAQVNFYCAFISEKYRDTAHQLSVQHDPDYEKVQELFIKPQTPEVKAELAAAKARLAPKLPRPPLSDLIDHIDHMAKVAGVDHVGLGSDFDGIDCSPQGLDSVADLPKITEALYQRSYNASDIDKILGGNLLRVFGDVEKVSREMQNQ